MTIDQIIENETFFEAFGPLVTYSTATDGTVSATYSFFGPDNLWTSKYSQVATFGTGDFPVTDKLGHAAAQGKINFVIAIP